MKAWILHDINDLRYETADLPPLLSGEVLIKVKAVGICGSDIPRIYHTGAHTHPLIPGHEFSGIVEQLGPDVDKTWLGRRVGVFPLIPCKTCAPCRKKLYEMCRSYDYTGSRRNGAFAEYVSVPAWNLIPLPEEASFEAAAMLEPMAVAVHAMRRAAPAPSDTVAVCGLGTIGLLLVMFLLDAGVKNLLVIGNKAFQKQTVLKLGLPNDAYCDSKTENVSKWLSARTDGMGADVFFECVGKNETYIQAIQNAAPAGTVILTGNPFSDMELPKDVYWKILRNQLTVSGTWNSSYIHDTKDDWNYVIERLAAKKIAPETLITHRLPLERLTEGLHIMRDKTEDYVKIMAIL